MSIENIKTVIVELERAGVAFERGLSDGELYEIQRIYGIIFPRVWRELYMRGVPSGEGFPRWGDFSEENVSIIKSLIRKPYDMLLHDVQHGFWLPAWGERPGADETGTRFAEVTKDAPPLFPVFGHRYAPCLDVVDDPPVISTVGRDTIYYGCDIADYVRREFCGEDGEFRVRPHIPFWGDIIDFTENGR